MGSRHVSITFFSLIIGLDLGRHLRYIEMLNDARVALLGFFKDNECSTRINNEKKIKFQVLLKVAQILPDYDCLTCYFIICVHFEFSDSLIECPGVMWSNMAFILLFHQCIIH